MRWHFKFYCCLFLTVLSPLLCLAGIEYDAVQNIIWVTDYPAWRPCVFADVVAANDWNGWNTVVYDQKSDLYVVRSHLYIGDANLRDTYFQVGDSAHRRIKVEMHGNIILVPDISAFWNDDRHRANVHKQTPGNNALLIGDADDSAIKPTIRFAAGYGLAVGIDGRARTHAGEIYLYNAVLTALPGETRRVIGVGGWLSLCGRTVRLINSCVENVKYGVKGVMGGGWDHVVSGVTFENMQVGLSQYWDNRAFKKPLRNCAFIKCDIALDRISEYLLIENCVFMENRQNWVFEKNKFKGGFLKNCEIDGIQTNGVLH